MLFKKTVNFCWFVLILGSQSAKQASQMYLALFWKPLHNP